MEKPLLHSITYKFTQDGNCVDGRDTEELIIEAKSSLGIEYDEGAFLVLKTDGWAIDDVSEIEDLITKVNNSIKIFTDKPVVEKSEESEVQESEEKPEEKPEAFTNKPEEKPEEKGYEYVIINKSKLYTIMTKHHHEQIYNNHNDYSKNLLFTVDKKNIIAAIDNGDKYYIYHDNNYIPVYYNHKQELVGNGVIW